MTKYQSYKKNRVQYVHQLTRQTYLWAKKVTFSRSNFDQIISIDTEGTARYRVTPYTVKVETKLNFKSPGEIELDNLFTKTSVIESGIYSKNNSSKNENEIYCMNVCDVAKSHCKKQPQQTHKDF